ncbi:hypothetical protein DCM91_17975 [Chitinophaga costaii]|nr:hypothetical protein [Chitinophaga costaii]PUZ20655.1 hypothetical protein DCM91_17975 [Chitinophaga costaii]
MDYSNIRSLLDKYWEGETSLEEEAQLKQFYNAAPADLPKDLQEAAPLFHYFEIATPTTNLPGFEALQTAFETPATTPVIKIGFLRNWMQYAAMLAIALGIGYGIQQHIEADRPPQHPELSFRQDTFNDPKEAFAETQKALQLLARNLNKGKQEMVKLNYFNEATDKVKEN